MTIKELVKDLNKAIRANPDVLNKEILIPEDIEGNGYFKLELGLTVAPKTVKECIEFSNGVADMDITDYSKYVILG